MRTEAMITREELFEIIDEIEFYPEVIAQLDVHLRNAILFEDIKFIKTLLEAGANPNPKRDLDCYIDSLRDRYESGKTLEGEFVLSIIEILLEHGADPNRVTINNLRAYDRAYFSSPEIAKMLEKFGVDKKLREII